MSLENLDLDSITKLSPPVLLMFFLNMVGYALNKSPIDNKYIPIIMFVLGGIIYPFIGMIEASQRHPAVHLGIIGCCIGGAAVGANQVLRQLKNTNEDKTTSIPQPKP